MLLEQGILQAWRLCLLMSINLPHIIPTLQDVDLVDGGTDQFGATASVIILPGGQVVPNSVIQTGTIVG